MNFDDYERERRPDFKAFAETIATIVEAAIKRKAKGEKSKRSKREAKGARLDWITKNLSLARLVRARLVRTLVNSRMCLNGLPLKPLPLRCPHFHEVAVEPISHSRPDIRE